MDSVVTNLQENVIKTSRLGKQNGFTLIELLVVIAIILILSAILFPVFARARESARRTSCTSNTKQIGIGLIMYAQDYDGTLPGAWFVLDPNVTGSYAYWTDIISPYTKNVQVLKCPSSPYVSSSPQTGNYGANNKIMIPYKGVPQDSITSPSEKYLILDWPKYSASPGYVFNSAAEYYLPGAGQFGGDCERPNTEKRKDECQRGRHFDGVNVTFADGHAKWLKSQIAVEQARRYEDGETSAWGYMREAS